MTLTLIFHCLLILWELLLLLLLAPHKQGQKLFVIFFIPPSHATSMERCFTNSSLSVFDDQLLVKFLFDQQLFKILISLFFCDQILFKFLVWRFFDGQLLLKLFMGNIFQGRILNALAYYRIITCNWPRSEDHAYYFT